MTKIKTAIVGFLVAPFMSASIGITQTEVFGDLDVATFFGLLPLFYFFSAVATILFGVPIFLILNRFKLIKWWSTLSAGMLIGALATIIFSFPNEIQFKALLTMSSMGGASAFFFWLIWSLGNRVEDNDQGNKRTGTH